MAMLHNGRDATPLTPPRPSDDPRCGERVVVSVLTRAFAEQRRDEPALVDDEGMVTWGEFDERVNRLIHALRTAGLRAGDTISIISGNRNEWFEVAFACSNSGITFVPVNWHLVASEIAYILEDSGSRAVVAGHRFADEVARALDDERASAVELALVAGAPSSDRFQNLEEFIASGSPDEPDDQSFGGPMFYTSGTTGHPKGVRGSLSSMEAGTTPEVWHHVRRRFLRDDDRPRGDRPVRAGLPLSAVGVLLPADDGRIIGRDAAQVRQCPTPRPHRYARRDERASRADPDEAPGRSPR
jgi:long-chain acyl-CoA synthetase